MNNKIDLKDCTFIIPFRCDSQDRLENIQLILSYLKHNFDTNIIVKESSHISFLGNDPIIQGIKYIWEFSDSEVFHRTKILNDMLEMVETKFVVNYDTDVLFPVEAYIDTLILLRSGQHFVFPYQGPFHEVSRRFIPQVKEKMEVNWIPLNECGLNHPSSVGGAMFLNTETYKKLGGEPENYFGWGWEDNYRVNLFTKFGYEIKRTGTVLYHFEHYRGINSGPSNPHHNQNQNEFFKCYGMNQTQLNEYINSWSRFRK